MVEYSYFYYLDKTYCTDITHLQNSSNISCFRAHSQIIHSSWLKYNNIKLYNMLVEAVPMFGQLVTACDVSYMMLLDSARMNVNK